MNTVEALNLAYIFGFGKRIYLFNVDLSGYIFYVECLRIQR